MDGMAFVDLKTGRIASKTLGCRIAAMWGHDRSLMRAIQEAQEIAYPGQAGCQRPESLLHQDTWELVTHAQS